MKSYNIILEGCDKTGKTTIAKRLAELGLVYITVHFTAPNSKKRGQLEYNNTLKILNKNEFICFDRWALGERVYAPIFRGYYPDYMDNLESKLKKHNYLFLLETDIVSLEVRFDEHNEKSIMKTSIKRIIEKFREEFVKSKYPNKFILNTTYSTPTQTIEKMFKYINVYEEENNAI